MQNSSFINFFLNCVVLFEISTTNFYKLSIITEEELKVIDQAIFTRYGIDFRNYESQSFRRRVSKVIRQHKLESVYALWKKILYEPDFIHEFINGITIGFTELFRNPDLWKFLSNYIKKLFLEENHVHIWHAGCSSGEEIYSMLITLDEMSVLNKATIIATDINSEDLLLARKGIIKTENMNRYEQNYRAFTSTNYSLKQYYEHKSDTYYFKKYLAKNCLFKLHNLTKDNMTDKFRIIFCRNVLIYFDDILKERVLEKFYHLLEDDGYLILGYFDTLPKKSEALFRIYMPEYKMFKKL